MKRGILALSLAALLALGGCRRGDSPRMAGGGEAVASGYAGSESCRECHEKFYQLWAGSHHGLAMQPFTAELYRTKLTPQGGGLRIGDADYRVEFDGRQARVREKGLEGERYYPLEHALGGKNVYYFLTPMERGRLQVLPLAYDVRRQAWFDTAASGIRHFHDLEEETVDWRDAEYTFNTSCWGCHVSQVARNYDLATDTYRSAWREPGINCEACHGSAVEHVRVCRAAEKGKPPADLKIDVIVPPRYGSEASSGACSVCHAKGAPLTASYVPGEDFFDHFDLGLFEHPDYHPDGRDLGENYTYTQWLMSPCANSGKLDCMHCHTSSGRFRFAAGDTNQACMPCHAENVKNAADHSRHPQGSEGNRCVSCHMPMTEFARMRRSDHSMLPPTPAATLAWKSPNACNLCHEEKDAAWADGWVRRWRKRDYQAPVLHRAGLVEAARRRDWKRLPDILAYLGAKERDAVFAASLIRLIRPCDDERKWPVLVRALSDPSPLVRSSAAEQLGDRVDAPALAALGGAVRDPSRLVRIRAAAALAAVPREMLGPGTAEAFDRAAAEFKATLDARPDHWASHFNLGGFHFSRGEYGRAAQLYETAIRLAPREIMPHVNVSFAYNALGKNDKAEASLRRALELQPDSAEVNLNLGLLLGEMGRVDEAAARFEAAARLDPGSAVAAYNLGVIHAQTGQTKSAIDHLRRAYRLQPGNAQYGYSLAFYLDQGGDAPGAAGVLRRVVRDAPAHLDAVFLLGDIYQRQGKAAEARELYRRALSAGPLAPEARGLLESRLRALKGDS
jgi:Tfp pilus assembly protein PilF